MQEDSFIPPPPLPPHPWKIYCRNMLASVKLQFTASERARERRPRPILDLTGDRFARRDARARINNDGWIRNLGSADRRKLETSSWRCANNRQLAGDIIAIGEQPVKDLYVTVRARITALSVGCPVANLSIAFIRDDRVAVNRIRRPRRLSDDLIRSSKLFPRRCRPCDDHSYANTRPRTVVVPTVVRRDEN